MFRNFVLQNFPFLEDDFDALTDYELFCKMMGYIKKFAKDNEDFSKRLSDVENYVYNLDLQDEVDNKIDELVENGTLAEIITSYLTIAGILGFDTKSALKAGTNFIDGSIARTLGTTTYDDGYGYYYKIRTLVNTDVIDDENILALTNFPTLVAERLNEKTPSTPKYIFIGDSYGQLEDQDTWIDIVIDKLGLTSNDYYRNTLGSTGFKATSSTSKRFIDLLEEVADELTSSQKLEITDIIVCGGANDTLYTTASEIESYVEAFITYAKTTFPNATIYVGCVGYNLGTNKKNLGNVIEAYNNANKYGGVYLKGCENAIHNYQYFTRLVSDQVHPNQDGSTAIGIAVYEAYKYGYSSTTHAMTANTTNPSTTGILYTSQNNDIYQLIMKSRYNMSYSQATFVCNPDNAVSLFDFGATVVGGMYTGEEIKFPCSPLLRSTTVEERINGWLCIESYVYDSTSIRQKLVFHPYVVDTLSGTGQSGFKKYTNVQYLVFDPCVLTFNNFEC